MRCNKCGNIMLKNLISHRTKIYNRNIDIPNIEGYSCPKCGNNVIEENMDEYLKERIHEEKLRFLKNTDIQPILISKIKEIRLSKKFSQRQIGNALKVTEQRYGAIERNVNTPTILISYQLADLFDVNSNELYELVYVSNDFHEKMINLELVEDDGGNYRFKYVEEVDTTRKKLYAIREEINKLNKEKRKLNFEKKKGDITEEECNKMIKEMTSHIEDELKVEKRKLERQLDKLEREYNLVVKQGHIIDVNDWKKLNEIFKEELNDAF